MAAGSFENYDTPRMDDPEDVEEPQKLEKADPGPQDAFGNEEFAEVKYKVLKWW